MCWNIHDILYYNTRNLLVTFCSGVCWYCFCDGSQLSFFEITAGLSADFSVFLCWKGFFPLGFYLLSDFLICGTMVDQGFSPQFGARNIAGLCSHREQLQDNGLSHHLLPLLFFRLHQI